MGGFLWILGLGKFKLGWILKPEELKLGWILRLGEFHPSLGEQKECSQTESAAKIEGPQRAAEDNISVIL